MELIQIANSMEKKIKELEAGRKLIKERGEEKAEAISQYEMSITITILKIKNGKLTEFEGEIIDSKLPGNLVEKIARGVCFKEKLEMEKAEALFKAGTVGMSAIEAELNGYQSMYKYLDKV